VTNAKVREFWLTEFPWGNRSVDVRHRREWLMPVQNKIGRLAVVDPLANILGQVKNKIKLRQIMDEQRLLIVNLDKGKIGERNANLLGSLLLSSLYHASFQRTNTHPFYLRRCATIGVCRAITSLMGKIYRQNRRVWSELLRSFCVCKIDARTCQTLSGLKNRRRVLPMSGIMRRKLSTILGKTGMTSRSDEHQPEMANRHCG
jgi:hypothetical protein